MTQIEVTEDVANMLNRLARRRGQTVSEVIAQSLPEQGAACLPTAEELEAFEAKARELKTQHPDLLRDVSVEDLIADMVDPPYRTFRDWLLGGPEFPEDFELPARESTIREIDL